MKKGLLYGQGVLQLFIGVGAVVGGLFLVADPSGETLGTPIQLLEKTPFTTFLVPGIVLFAVNGLGSLAGAIATFTRHQNAGELAMVLGGFLAAWIGVQGYWFAGFYWLHWLYLSLGIAEIGLGWSMRATSRRSAS